MILDAFRWGVPGLPGEKIAMENYWLTFTPNSYTICFILPHGLQHQGRILSEHASADR